MSVSADYLVYVIDQFASVAKLVTRRMFGAVGLYADGLFFALIDDDVLYLKVDDRNRDDYVARGGKAFQPFADDPTYSMNYFQLPEDVLEDPDELRVWARKSLDAALTKANSRKPAASSGTAKPRAKRTRTTSVRRKSARARRK